MAESLDLFVGLIRDLMMEAGIPDAALHCERNLELPGFFRAEKKWDLIVVVDETLIASVEFKSQVGPSFANNDNNRTEEALGSATDLWLAYREGAFRTSQRPWLGYLMLLEETPQSMSPVAVREPHFKVFDEFREAAYAKLCENVGQFKGWTDRRIAEAFSCQTQTVAGIRPRRVTEGCSTVRSGIRRLARSCWTASRKPGGRVATGGCSAGVRELVPAAVGGPTDGVGSRGDDPP